MSTNYYVKRIPTIEEVSTVQQAIASATPDNIQEILMDQQEYIEEKSESIHLGKRASGWKFNWELWDNKYYDCSLKSIRKFLQSKIDEGWVIISENHERFSVDEFFNEINYWVYDPNGKIGSSMTIFDRDANVELRFSVSKDFR